MPPFTLRDGARIHYEVLGPGSGTPVALTPGGRSDREAMRPLAERLAAAGYGPVIYDRRNCGASDVTIARQHDASGAELSEQEIWADDLHELLSGLGVEPCWVGGASAGCRVSLLLALRHPEAVRGLLVWMVTGGAVAAERLGYMYYEQFIEVAEKEGIDGVLRTPFFAERVAANPSNRERLLVLAAQEFTAIMREWRSYFTADKPLIGTAEAQLRAIRVPAMIIAGGDDGLRVPPAPLHPRPARAPRPDRRLPPGHRRTRRTPGAGFPEETFGTLGGLSRLPRPLAVVEVSHRISSVLGGML